MQHEPPYLDNAALERWFSTVKAEFGETFESSGHGKQQLFDTSTSFHTWAAGELAARGQALRPP